jgi:uncharacterized protein (TIGR02147 family)
MKEQIAIQKILHQKYGELKSRNPGFSRRAFSKRLGLSPGAISELFNGQRKASLKLAERIASRLALDPQERAELFSSFKAKGESTSQNPSDTIDPQYLQLSADQFHIIGDWYHFAILTLMRVKNFKSDINWIAERLGLSKSTVQLAMDRLKRVELVKEDNKHHWTRSKTRFRTTDDVANISVRKAHAQYIDKAREALDTVPVNRRDYTSLMMSVNPEQLPLAKEKIRKFQDELSAELEKHPGSEVYQLCIQLFPLTNQTGDKNEK